MRILCIVTLVSVICAISKFMSHSMLFWLQDWSVHEPQNRGCPCPNLQPILARFSEQEEHTVHSAALMMQARGQQQAVNCQDQVYACTLPPTHFQVPLCMLSGGFKLGWVCELMLCHLWLDLHSHHHPQSICAKQISQCKVSISTRVYMIAHPCSGCHPADILHDTRHVLPLLQRQTHDKNHWQ